jgi:DNA-binding XRE family transcriptional regulator
MNSTTRLQKLHLLFDGRRQPTPADRAWALAECGVTQRQIAAELDVSKVTVHQVLFDKATSYNIASAIAERTGLTLKRLWPCGKYALSPAERRALSNQQKEAA